MQCVSSIMERKVQRERKEKERIMVNLGRGYEKHPASVSFIEIKDVGHFATLAPTNALIAQKIVQDTEVKSQLSISAAEVNKLFTR